VHAYLKNILDVDLFRDSWFATIFLFRRISGENPVGRKHEVTGEGNSTIHALWTLRSYVIDYH